MPQQMVKRSLILSTDIGVEMDDQWALAHLLLSPELDVLGVVTAQAPVLVQIDENGIMQPQQPAPPSVSSETARHAQAVIDLLPLQSQPPVFAGLDAPLKNDNTPAPNAGVDFIIASSKVFTPENRLAVLVTGPATDVAAALINEPALAERIEVIAMGYNTWPEGTDLFNVKNDITAWKVLMDSRTPIVVGDAAVCMQHLTVTREKARTLFSNRGHVGTYLVNLLVSWLDHHGDKGQGILGDPDVWAVWDEVTTAYLLGMTTQETHPRPRLRDDMAFEHPDSPDATHPTITWITSIDETALWADFTHKLDEALGKQ